MMDREKFSELAVKGYTVVPLKQKIQTQYQDPISLFKKVRSITVGKSIQRIITVNASRK